MKRLIRQEKALAEAQKRNDAKFDRAIAALREQRTNVHRN
jgi:hypothetical protein